MLSRLCLLLVALWLAPPVLMNPKSAYRDYLRQKNAALKPQLNFGGVIPRIIPQPEEEQKLGSSFPNNSPARRLELDGSMPERK